MGDGESLSKDLTLEEFRRFRDYVHQHSGIYMEESKMDSLRISLLTRATRLNFRTLDDYFGLLSRDEVEFKELMNLVTINETSFFRFPAQFEALKNHVIPEIMSRKPDSNRALRIWSAGCSTGEEPYSIAMTVLDTGSEGFGWEPNVLGTDVSTNALGVAKRACYPQRNMNGVPPDVLARYFDQDGSEWRVRKKVRDLVELQYHNLIKEPYPLALMGNWDIIFCRNVTIYFKVESTKRVVSNFYNSLNEGGYLFIGHSETLSQISDDFHATEIGGVFLYHKPPHRRPVLFSGFQFPVKPPQKVHETRGERVIARERRKAEREEREARAAASEKAKNAEQAGKALLDQARKAFEEGAPETGRALVEQLLEIEPRNAQAWLLTAYAHADAGYYDEALSACKRALQIDPLLPAARYILGVIYLRAGDQARAVTEFKKTIYVDADFAMAHLNLANLYKSQGRWDAASKEYGNALRALKKAPEGAWSEFLGGFKADVLIQTCERSLIECRKAMGIA